MKQQQVRAEQPELLEPRNVSHPVFEVRGDDFVLVLAGVSDHSDAALLCELRQAAKKVVRAGDRNPHREPGLQPAVERALELGHHVVGPRKGVIGRLEEALGQIAHRSLPHIEHRARKHAAHSAFFHRLCGFRGEVAARVGKASDAGANHLDLGETRGAQGVAAVHVSLDHP